MYWVWTPDAYGTPRPVSVVGLGPPTHWGHLRRVDVSTQGRETRREHRSGDTLPLLFCSLRGREEGFFVLPVC